MGIRDKWPETFFSSLLKAAPFPEIKSTHSLVAKHVTPEKWEKLAEHKTATSGFTLAQVSVWYFLNECRTFKQIGMGIVIWFNSNVQLICAVFIKFL